ncbi:unnamed protein product [Plutella xylostella]|uniref:Fatty acyl-CoA reductase n=1 Tax=Plutella xylostella TaxID=51655 RepID=A0A8S4G3V2_PLUXY|nr:unnamed protein product [Plutella xylostella]
MFRAAAAPVVSLLSIHSIARDAHLSRTATLRRRIFVFDRLKEEVPKFRHKIVAVAGDCGSAGLGLTLADRHTLAEKVNIIFHSAATVKFDEDLRTALETNVRAPLHVLRLARDMRGLDVRHFYIILT